MAAQLILPAAGFRSLEDTVRHSDSGTVQVCTMCQAVPTPPHLAHRSRSMTVSMFHVRKLS